MTRLTGRIVAWKIGAAVDRAGAHGLDGWASTSLQYARHTYAGFTTGKWEGDVLTTYTTHVKAGYLRRNGVPSSDQAVITEHLMRHGDTLTISAHIDDPVYLSQIDVISRAWTLDNHTEVPPTPLPCVPEVEIPRLDGTGTVPHLLPGKNPFTREMTARGYHIPEETVLGGADELYPEYRKKLKAAHGPREAHPLLLRMAAAGGRNGRKRPRLDCITSPSDAIAGAKP